MKQIPKTVAKFEQDFNALKGSDKDLMAYLMHIPPTTIEALFKKSEIPTEAFSGILKTLALYNYELKTDKQWVGQFMLSLSKANNFEMTLMFAGEQDRKNIAATVAKIEKFDKPLAMKVQKSYTEE